MAESNQIHPTAIVSPKANLGKNVTIGAFSIIYDNVELGENVHIASHCEIGVPSDLAASPLLKIEKNATIRSHSIFYAGSSFKDSLVTGHRVTVRENTVAGHNLQIGTLSDIQGDCTIGDYARFHSNVHIGKKSKIEDYVWIFPYVVLTNDPHPPSEVLMGVTVEKFAVIATMSVILPGILIGEGALVAAHSCVTKNVTKEMVVGGNPARELGATSKIKLKDGTERQAYPWTNHFHRGYPKHIQDYFFNRSGGKIS